MKSIGKEGHLKFKKKNFKKKKMVSFYKEIHHLKLCPKASLMYGFNDTMTYVIIYSYSRGWSLNEI